MKVKSNNLFLFCIMMMPIVYAIVIYNKLPDRIPIHWNMSGEIDNYGSKWTIFILPVFINIPLFFLLLFFPRIDPKKENYQKFENGYQAIRWSVQLFLVLISIIIIHSTLTGKILDTRIVSISIFFLFIIIGNYMRTLKRNYFVGIRTPWTLANENVWRITHEHVGKVWFYASVVGLVLSFFVPEIYSIFLVVAITLTLTVYACWFSYHVFTLEK